MAGTLDQSFTTNNNDASCGVNSNLTYMSQGFTSGLDGEIDQIDLYLKKFGTPAMTFYIGIWSNNVSDEPDTLLSSETAFDADTLTSAFAWTTIVFSSPATASDGTKQQIVVRASATDGSNYMKWGSDSAGGYAGGFMQRSADGSTWVDQGGSPDDGNFKTYVTSAGWSGGSVNGVASASIASRDTVALASIDSINTV